MRALGERATWFRGVDPLCECCFLCFLSLLLTGIDGTKSIVDPKLKPDHLNLQEIIKTLKENQQVNENLQEIVSHLTNTVANLVAEVETTKATTRESLTFGVELDFPSET